MTEEKICHGGKVETYTEFVDKFKPKLTTDDCYTPPAVYNLIKDYACNKFGIKPESIVRPFKPGGDYQAEDYTGTVVLDNPPFSIISDICEYYTEHGVSFFLFCNGLTSQGIRHAELYGFVIVNSTIRYNNGAKVKTCFVHNFDHNIVLDGTLTKELRQLQAKPQKPKTPRPPHVYTSADLMTMTPKNGGVIIIKNREPYAGNFYGKAIYTEDV